MLKKILFNVHWLVGITVGIALALMGTTGAMMVFEEEILSVLNGRPAHVSATGAALTADEVLARAQAANPGKPISNLVFAADPERAVKIEFVRQAPGRAAPGEDDGSQWVNQYTGEVKSANAERGKAFMAWVEHLHRRLAFWRNAQAAGAGAPMGQQGGPGGGGKQFSLGEQATSYAVLFLMIMALTGLYLRWPRRKASEWRSWLKLNIKLKGYAFYYNLHAVVGTVVFFGYLMSAHSGLMMSEIGWYKNAVNSLAGVRAGEGRGPGGPGGGNAVVNDTQYQLSLLWAAFQREVPEFATATLQLSDSNAQELKISYLLSEAITKEGGRNTNSIVLDASTGAVKSHELFSAKPALQRVVTRNFDLHSGGYFGTPGRIFIMCTSLMMPVLLVTGWLQYLARRKQKKQRAAAVKAAVAG